MTYRRYIPPSPPTPKQRAIAVMAGPWTCSDYFTSAAQKAIDAAWVKASQWTHAEWKRRNPTALEPSEEARVEG